MQKINVSITPNGEVKIQMEGVKGKTCLDYSKEIEDALGEVIDRKFTSEYYQGELLIKKQYYLKEEK